MIKIAILGPESTGKSQLAQQLSAYFNCDWVPEYAREYLSDLNRPYTSEDLIKIAQGQLDLENKYLSNSQNQLLFIDTNLEVIKVWHENAFNYCPEIILREIAVQNYDLYLLTNIDLPWTPDPQREHPLLERRQYFYNIYLDICVNSGIFFKIISGKGQHRFEAAKATVLKFLETI